MRTDDLLRHGSGRWVRQGNRVVLLPAITTAGPEAEAVFHRPFPLRQAGPPPVSTAGFTQCDFIHKNIDVSAQYALFQLLRGPSAGAALQMLAAVRNGALGGIYQEDQQVPALRARDHLQMGWWDLVTNLGGGRDAACITRPAPPILVFRRSIAGNRALLGSELVAAFATCRVPVQPAPVPTAKPCGPRLPRPGPGPATPVKTTLCVDPSSVLFLRGVPPHACGSATAAGRRRSPGRQEPAPPGSS